MEFLQYDFLLERRLKDKPNLKIFASHLLWCYSGVKELPLFSDLPHWYSNWGTIQLIPALWNVKISINPSIGPGHSIMWATTMARKLAPKVDQSLKPQTIVPLSKNFQADKEHNFNEWAVTNIQTSNYTFWE